MKRKILLGTTCFIPTLIGIIFWNSIPEKVPIDFNMLASDYYASNYASKIYFLFIFPLIIFCIYVVLALIAEFKPEWVRSKKNCNNILRTIPIINFIYFLLVVLNS